MTEADLPDPGEGRYWDLRADGLLRLNLEAPPEDVQWWNEDWALLDDNYVTTSNIRRVATEMVRRADEAGTYKNNNGKLVKE